MPAWWNMPASGERNMMSWVSTKSGYSVPNRSNAAAANTGTSIGTAPPEWLETSSAPSSGSRSRPRTTLRCHRLVAGFSSGNQRATNAGSRRS